MIQRPLLDKNLDRKTFRDFYYLKEELVDFCRQNNLPVSGGKLEITERISHFLTQLLEDYMALGMGEKNVLFKMKESWWYLGKSFPGQEKTLKSIRKAERLDRYRAAVEELL